MRDSQQSTIHQFIGIIKRLLLTVVSPTRIVCVSVFKPVPTQVMGQNFALNMASHGFTVSVCNRSPEKVDATIERAKSEGDLPLKGYKEPKEFVESISKPRRIILLVQAGKAVDSTIAVLSEFMEVSYSGARDTPFTQWVSSSFMLIP